jgi:hypothetical protein
MFFSLQNNFTVAKSKRRGGGFHEKAGKGAASIENSWNKKKC